MNLWIIMSLFALVVMVAFLLLFYFQRKRHNRLYRQILHFMNEENRKALLPLSMKDHSFSLIENQIVELEERILHYKAQLQKQQQNQQYTQ